MDLAIANIKLYGKNKNGNKNIRNTGNRVAKQISAICSWEQMYNVKLN